MRNGLAFGSFCRMFYGQGRFQCQADGVQTVASDLGRFNEVGFWDRAGANSAIPAFESSYLDRPCILRIASFAKDALEG